MALGDGPKNLRVRVVPPKNRVYGSLAQIIWVKWKAQKDIRSFFRPIPKVERTEPIESSRLSAVQEATIDDDDDGFFVAAPHVVNSPPKLSPIPLIEGIFINIFYGLQKISVTKFVKINKDTPPPSPETNRIQSTSREFQKSRDQDDSGSSESDSDSDDESVKSLPGKI